MPSSLSEVTLGQRIAFQEKYGAELDKMAHSISDMPESIEKDLEKMQYYFESAIRTFAFYTNTTVEAIRESSFVDDIQVIYESCIAVMAQEEEDAEPKGSFIWNDQEWVIESPELRQDSRMSFGELIDAKQIVKDMADLGKGKWESMLPLCAIYLRKKNEPYKEEFAYEDSDRRELMKSLPMSIAIHVGFFLISTINFYLNISTFSESQESKAEEKISSSTLTVGAGSTS